MLSFKKPCFVVPVIPHQWEQTYAGNVVLSLSASGYSLHSSVLSGLCVGLPLESIGVETGLGSGGSASRFGMKFIVTAFPSHRKHRTLSAQHGKVLNSLVAFFFNQFPKDVRLM